MNKIIKSFKSLRWYETIMCLVMIGIATYYAIIPTEDCPQWLAIVNLISGICGVICVFLCAKANRINFFFATINTVAYMIYLWYFGIWATFFLEAIVYFPLNIISWILWNKHKDEDDELLAKSKTLTLFQNIIVGITIFTLTVIVHYGLSNLAGNSWVKVASNFGWNVAIIQWIDCLTFAIGIVAVILEAMRYKEQYFWWIITDIFAVALYALKKDPVYTTKKTIYLIEAIIGIKNWNKLSKKNTINE